MRHLFLNTFFFAILAFSVACTSENEEDLNSNNGGGQNDSTDVVSYSEDVVPILESRCIGCHNANQASGGVQLDSYDGVKAAADNGSLVGSIKHEEGFSAMPRNGAKLSDSQISIIENWVKDGTANN